jgi:hypothetical protein
MLAATLEGKSDAELNEEIQSLRSNGVRVHEMLVERNPAPEKRAWYTRYLQYVDVVSHCRDRACVIAEMLRHNQDERNICTFWSRHFSAGFDRAGTNEWRSNRESPCNLLLRREPNDPGLWTFTDSSGSADGGPCGSPYPTRTTYSWRSPVGMLAMRCSTLTFGMSGPESVALGSLPSDRRSPPESVSSDTARQQRDSPAPRPSPAAHAAAQKPTEAKASLPPAIIEIAERVVCNVRQGAPLEYTAEAVDSRLWSRLLNDSEYGPYLKAAPPDVDSIVLFSIEADKGDVAYCVYFAGDSPKAFAELTLRKTARGIRVLDGEPANKPIGEETIRANLKPVGKEALAECGDCVSYIAGWIWPDDDEPLTCFRISLEADRPR